MSKQQPLVNKSSQSIWVVVGLVLCACIVALPPLLLWLVITLDILGYALLASFIIIFALTARANLGGRRSSAFFANGPLHWHPTAQLKMNGKRDKQRETG